ncbi:response regulator [Chitinibacter sp. FCG-7]|uniref:Response regulator n=1 Tax=Chitinibacter mangrovi TaxID=3153927 RepID=A0AAU7FEB5_9NEIS
MAHEQRFPSAESIHIIVLDDDDGVRKGLNSILTALGYRVTSFASSGELYQFLKKYHADCLILDVCLSGEDGRDVLRELQSLTPNLPVIMLTSHGDIDLAVKSMKMGALDFLQKPAKAHELNSAILEAIKKQKHTTQALPDQLAVALYTSLTRREKEVMDGVIEHLSNVEIAEKLNISGKTVETHRANLIKKIGSSSPVEMYLIREKKAPAV